MISFHLIYFSVLQNDLYVWPCHGDRFPGEIQQLGCHRYGLLFFGFSVFFPCEIATLSFIVHRVNYRIIS